MALLAGSETEGTVEMTITTEHAHGPIVVAAKSGTVESLQFKCAKKGTQTSIIFAIYSVNEGTVPRTPLAIIGTPVTRSGNLTENQTVEVTGFGAKVEAGKEYALLALAIGGTLKYKRGITGGSGENSKPAKVTSYAEITEWIGETGIGGGFFAAFGTESGSAKIQAVGGSLSLAGSLPRATTAQLPAGVTFSGTLQRSTSRRLVAALSFAGALPRNTARSLPASLSFAGALPRNVVHGLFGSLTFAGQLPRSTRHQFAAALTFLGKLTPQEVGKAVHRIEAVLSFEGRLGRKTTRQLPAGLSFQGALQRSGSRQLPAALSFTGSLQRNTKHPMSASLSFAGTLGRAVRIPLSASLSFAGRLAFKGAKALGLAGFVSPFQRRGRSSPLSRLGRGNPRPAHKTPSLYPDEGLYPEDTLYPGGGEIEPD